MGTNRPAMRRRVGQHRRVDVAMVRLVRAVLDPDWEPRAAAASLDELLSGSPAAVAQVRARVCRAAAQHRSRITDRALATLEALSGRETA